MKPVLINFLRRLDKTFSKIHKNQRIYVSTDWSAVASILRGLYQTVWKYPHIMVNMQNFKNLVTTCQYLIIGQPPSPAPPAPVDKLCAGEDPQEMPGGQSRKCSLPSREFCDVVLLLISLQVLTMGEAYSLEQRVQLPDNFASSSLASSQQEKGEITLLNLLLPLLLLVGSGRKVTAQL